MLPASDDWRCDQFKWEHFGQKLLKTEPVICKTYFNYMADSNVKKEFKRYAYSIYGHASNLTLIHYKGDDSVVHENLHIRTCGSVLRELETTMESPSVAYKKKIADCKATMLQQHSVLLPRNIKQVTNCQSLRRQAYRLSHDALYNLHELSYDIPGFVHKIVTYPDLIIVCGIKMIFTECNRLLALHSTLPTPQLLSYDTTFQLGDFFVSPLLFRNTLFEKSPVMPVMLAIHERKLKSTHTEMMSIVARELPYLARGSSLVPLVTDDERGFFEAVDFHLMFADYFAGIMPSTQLNLAA